MKFLLQCVLIGVFSWLATFLLPWWWGFIIPAAVLGFLLKNSASFLSGFLALFFLWVLLAWVQDYHTSTHLADKVARIFSPVLNRFSILCITGTLGGLVGGLATLTGSLLRRGKRKSVYSF